VLMWQLVNTWLNSGKNILRDNTDNSNLTTVMNNNNNPNKPNNNQTPKKTPYQITNKVNFPNPQKISST
jgi:hypothetical protein